MAVTSFNVSENITEIITKIKKFKNVKTMQEVIEVALIHYYNSFLNPSQENFIEDIEDTYADNFILVPLSIYIANNNIPLREVKRRIDKGILKSISFGDSVMVVVEFNERLYTKLEMGILKNDIISIKKEIKELKKKKN